MEIFGNKISDKTYKKACKNQKKMIKRFGDDRNQVYPLMLNDNEVLTPPFGLKNIVIKNDNNSNESDANLSFQNQLPKNPIIIGNIRMGFGHYRISMAMASAAKALGYTPLWLDLNSFPQTTCTKIISYQNNLYSMGSRLSQKYSLFNKLFWEPMNYEGFKKLSYNAGDQKNAELMTTIFKEIPKDIPVIGTHVWPAQAAVHSGMKYVVNAIPDNWPMALHLAEGALHTVQTENCFLGYKTLHGFDGTKVLNPMPEDAITYTGHYIDYELVENIEKDCENRIERAKNGKPIRFLFTIGGAGAQGDFFEKKKKKLLPYVKEKKACIYLNCGDYENVWESLKKKIPELNASDNKDFLISTHFNNWDEEKSFAENAAIDTQADSIFGNGIHVFCNKNIFSAVYITNLLMRACDFLITKPSELAFYPVPKLFIKRIGGHEMWGAIHSADIGDGSQECETPEYACAMIEQILNNPQIEIRMCENIIKNNNAGIYNGACEVVKKAVSMGK
ncbi:MAG: hypothetical protein MJ188_10990 [Treponema sp.]|nr:hypothetical protein [Treponema sp.]